MTYPKNNSPRHVAPKRKSTLEAFERTRRRPPHFSEDILEILSDSRENEKARQIGNWERMRIESLRSPR